ncbi:MAG: hypothetical protein ACPLPR_07060 [Bacillota bacterium]
MKPAESKRLIAKAVAAMPEVKQALTKGKVVIALGGTNSLVAEEIVGVKVAMHSYMAGYIGNGQLKVTPKEGRMDPFVLVDGKPVNMSLDAALSDFDAGDVFIKGANAVDPQSRAGIIVADGMSGTIGKALPYLMARGSHLVVPVGLEKLVPDVVEAAKVCGQRTFKYGPTRGFGLVPLVGAKVVTEIQAMQILFGIKAIHVASGGIDGGEGSVVLVLEGEDSGVAQAVELVERLKAS